ncbi:5714_t:CDS:2 [Racocetra fulgida]|uniref:5714_t:CDS:1 n=1 Tax=Racocetra fulgida TaxID=60492 RepID=A0A9N9EZV7_9GLOM|nr:5714_t:CDS:2 [Racocetra fulgida]
MIQETKIEPILQIQGSANILCVHVPNLRRVLFCHSFQDPNKIARA